MHSPYASKKRPSKVSSLHLGFLSGVCVFKWRYGFYVCVRWCAWHLLYKNTGVTHQITLCRFLLSHL